MTFPGPARRLLLPSLSDCLFFSLLLWLFATGCGWSALLADGDTGWHIRTGEFILDRGELPARDLFSFSKAGEPWLAWEWLADVLFAVLYRLLGLKGVVLLAGVVISLGVTLVFRQMLWRGANALLALAVCLLGAGASGIHYLARPHVFTLLLLPLCLWLVDRDRAHPSPWVWLAAPITAIWANLHAGFLSLVACLVLIVAGRAAEAFYATRRVRLVWSAVRRQAALLAACLLASLMNPYGIRLHAHIAEYLRSGWIRQAVHEFQSPSFRSEAAGQFEMLLFAGPMMSGFLLRRRQFADALLVLFWAHAALISVRHVPVYIAITSPIWTAELSRLWARWAAGRPVKSAAAILDGLARDVAAGCRRTSAWIPLLILALAFVDKPMKWPGTFPEVKFPAGLIERNAARIAGARVFTSDQWGDFLIFRFHPRQRVFIDGRSDFYGPALGNAYLKLAYVHPEWKDLLDKYSLNLVLAPTEWPLATALAQDAGWREVDRDHRAVLFERRRPQSCH